MDYITKHIIFAHDHTTLNTLVLVRLQKKKNIRRKFYLNLIGVEIIIPLIEIQ
jgi:hypothetical protein